MEVLSIHVYESFTRPLLQMELAFARGYDPALELASAAKRRNASHQSDASPSEPVWPEHVRRREQDLIDRVIRGAEAGQYYMLLGPKVSTTT